VRVLLVRLDGVGDAAACVPLIAALREAGHGVGVALTTRNAGLFSPLAVEAEHVLERHPWPAHGSTAASTAAAKAQIAQQRYDVALIASEEPEAYRLACGIPTRIGFTTGLLRPFKNVWVRAHVTRAIARSQRAGAPDAHEVEVLYRLGATLVRSPLPSCDTDALRPVLLAGAAPARSGGTIVLQAGAKWAAVGVSDGALREVTAALGGRLRVVAAPSDAAAARDALHVDVETFADLHGWVRALDASTAVITPDTGAAHVAGMLGVPVIDVFGDTGFAAQVRRWRPWASPYAVLRASQLAGGTAAAAVEGALDAL
jgi:ADP-heptose:LPS heptosyltransferase